MSTILDALEKANKARRKGGKANGLPPGEAAERERQLAAEADRVRTRTRFLLFMMTFAVLVLLILGGIFIAIVASRSSNSDAAPPVVAVVQPTASPAPTVAPTPEPTPQAPLATPSPTATPQPTPPPAATAAATRFLPNQVVYPGDLGVRIEGVFVDGANSSVIIDGNNVDIGRKYKGIRPLSIHGALIDAEVDQYGGTVQISIRYK